ncbi:hypothetical protein QCA50_009279 [Cerrena zonata]|uniref:Uncharacterized protein n=1 Tax=Cerrena zonata TaxID=2478898 RepID=A0AAW0GB83_9APHY
MIEQNTFENSIKDHKLEFEDEGESNLTEEEKTIPELSPTAVEDTQPSIHSVLNISDSNQLNAVLETPPQLNEHHNQQEEAQSNKALDEERKPEHESNEVHESNKIHESNELNEGNESNEVNQSKDDPSKSQQLAWDSENQQPHEAESQFPWNQPLISQEERFPFEKNQVPSLPDEHLINDDSKTSLEEFKKDDLPWYNDDLKHQPWDTGDLKFKKSQQLSEKDLPQQNSSENRLPWDDDHPSQNESVPWENEHSQQNENLPWEENQQNENLPWEENQQNENLPWEEDQQNENLPWDVNQNNSNQLGTKLPWEDQQKDTHFSPLQENKQELGFEQSEDVKLPWDEGEDNQQKPKSAQESENKLPWEQGQSHEAIDESQSHERKGDLTEEKLDALFADDNDDVFFSKGASKSDNEHFDTDNKDLEQKESLTNDKSINDLFDSNDEFTIKSSKDISRTDSNGLIKDETRKFDKTLSGSKDKPSLDFLLDDDLLLDEDQLALTAASSKSSVSQKEQLPKHTSYQPKKGPHHSYVPHKPSVPSGQKLPPKASDSQQFVRNLEASKKKNDAYDFPDSLITQKIKPAPRHENKYAPSASSSSHSLPPPKQGISSNHSSPVMPPPARPGNSLRSSSTSSHPSSKPKAFFEELPVQLPKAGARPARAAAPVKTATPVSNASPGLVKPQLSAKVKSPVNPYAKLGPPPQAPNQVHGSVLPPNQPIGSVPPAGGLPPPPMGQPMGQPGTIPPPMGQPGTIPPPMGQPGTIPPPMGQPSTIPPPMGQPGMAPPPAGQTQFGSPSMGQTSMVPPSANPPAVVPSAAGQAHSRNNFGFPNVQNQSQSQTFPSVQPNKPTLNTNVPRSQNKGSATSPYVPNVGPYAPNSHRRGHSRASSLGGWKRKRNQSVCSAHS